MERMSVEERRARLVTRHRLAPEARGEEPIDAVRAVIALHSTDPATVFLSTWVRTREFTPLDLERDLYETRELVRMLGMRRTLFVVPRELAPVVDAACTRAIAARERRKLEGFVVDSGVTSDPSRWIDELSAAALFALDTRGEAFTSELSADDPLLATKLRLGVGTRWEAEVGAATRILPLLAAEGAVVRGRPRGSWISSQYRWARAAPLPPADPGEARAELLRLWLTAFGPGTEADIRWWTAWTAREAREALADVAHDVVDLDGVIGFVVAGDTAPTAAQPPCVVLLPSLDPTTMGWKNRGWYLGPHAPALFDTNGNAGPTVWWDGRVVGGWAQRKDGAVVYRLLEDVGADVDAAVADEAARLGAWLGDVRITPRFPTPLQRELVA